MVVCGVALCDCVKTAWVCILSFIAWLCVCLELHCLVAGTCVEAELHCVCACILSGCVFVCGTALHGCGVCSELHCVVVCVELHCVF